MIGIYKKIFDKVRGKNKSKNKTKTRKKMGKKLTPEQRQARRAKFKGAFKKTADFVQSGKVQQGATALTRWQQGKPIVIQKPQTEEQQAQNPDEFIIMGLPIKKTYVYIGSALLIGGIAFIATRKRKQFKTK